MTDQSTDPGIMPNPNNYVSPVPTHTIVLSIVVFLIVILLVHVFLKYIV